MSRELAQLFRVRSAYGGRFDADGRTLLFVSDIAGVPQVWALRTAAWPELVVAPRDRAMTIHPGPNPGQLVVAADVAGNEQSQLLLARGGVATPLVDDPAHRYNFGAWSDDGRRLSYAANVRDLRWFDVYVRDLEGGAERRVLEHDSTNAAGDFSPDGRSLLVTRVFSNSEQELWLVDLEGGEPRLLTPTRARYGGARFLSDGRTLLVLTDLGRDVRGIATLALADGTVRYLVEADAEIDALVVSDDRALVAYALNRDGVDEIRIRQLGHGGESRVERLPRGAIYSYWQRGLAFDRAGTKLAISWTGERANPDVWVHDLARGRTRQATRAPRAGVSPARLAASELVRYPTFDGREIPALWYGARGRASPPPCVVFVHGGPEGQFRPNWQPVVQHLVASGFAVLAPNVRGSSGYGNTYGHLDDVRKRMDSVDDLAHAVRWLVSSGRADAERIAVWGGSYGGFMVLASLATYPELWAAGVCLVGISNFVTFLERTSAYRRHLREAEYGSLANDREFLESISPLHRVERITAPLLLIHGVNDPRVPFHEAEQIQARLKELGRTVELIRFDDEGHQIAKLRNRLVAYPAAIAFLRHHLMRRR